ncbi:MAG: hypothetical protein RL176_606 [Pseudomonadota bacterium]|jgi:hypothetical protein
MTINFNTDYIINIDATLVAVTDTELWLSAEATGGDSTDSIVINWTNGTREKSIEALKQGVGVEIGGKISVRGERGNWGKLSWTVLPTRR